MTNVKKCKHLTYKVYQLQKFSLNVIFKKKTIMSIKKDLDSTTPENPSENLKGVEGKLVLKRIFLPVAT